MADDQFKLPGSSYEELCRVIQSYGHFEKPTSLDELSQTAKMHRTAISRNNGFLTAVGIIEGGHMKTTTPLGHRLARAIEHDQVDDIAEVWRSIAEANEFLSKMLAAIRIRKGMDEATLQSHIAYSAGQPKNKEVFAGARAVIDILKAARLIDEQDGKLVPSLTARPSATSNSDIVRDMNSPTIESPSSPTEEPMVAFDVRTGSRSADVVVNIQIQISANPSELEGLGEKIRRLVDEIRNLSDDNGQSNDRSSGN